MAALADMNCARKGRAFEHEIRNLLHRAGYSVMRGAGSLDKRVDLIATKLTAQTEYRVLLTIVGVQCKTRKRARRAQALNLKT